MFWLWVTLGLFAVIAAGMYVPDSIRWARWNSKRKRLPESKRRKMRPPVAAPFWSSYSSPLGTDGGSAGPAGDACGGGDGDGGGCD